MRRQQGRLILFLGLTVLAVVSLGAADPRLAKAERALAKGRLGAAREMYEKILEAEPEAWNVHLALAALDRDAGLRREAFETTQLVDLRSGDPTWRGRSLALQAGIWVDQFRERSVRESIEEMGSEATKPTAEFLDAQPRFKGDVDVSLAAKALRVAGLVHPSRTHQLTDRVRQKRREAEELESAQKALHRGTALAGDSAPELWLQQAELFRLREQWVEAQSAFEKFSRLCPQEAAVHPLRRCLELMADRDPSVPMPRGDDPEVARPTRVGGPNPAYTPVARRARIEGLVVAEAVIASNGEVTCVNLIKDLPFGLGDAMAQTLNSWKFEPATRDGEAIDVAYVLVSNFRLARR